MYGVSHHGESPLYAVETIDPRAVLDPEPRVLDCSFALDRLLEGSDLDLGALGHSSGGATVIALAGGVFDPAAMAAYCASEEAREDRGCAYGLMPVDAEPSATSTPIAPLRHRDPRIRAVVALDPALGPGVRCRIAGPHLDPRTRRGSRGQRLPAAPGPRRAVRTVDPGRVGHPPIER